MKNNTSLPRPGRKGAITRLIVLALFTLIAFLSSIGTLPDFIAKQGFGQAIVEAIAGCGVLLLVGAWFWGLFKWVAVVAPKSFRVAATFWQGWIPLTFLGLYIKACIWLIIAIAPISIYTVSFGLLFNMTAHFTFSGINFFAAVGIFFIGMASTALLAFIDVCKIKGLSPIAVLRSRLCRKGGAAAYV